MKRQKAILLTAILIVMLLSSACSGTATSALTALKKIQAATEVGVSYQQYSQLVVDAKAAVNDATSNLPDGELKAELQAAMEAYVDAGEGWANTKTEDMPILGRRRILRLRDFASRNDVGQRLRGKYNIKTFMEDLYEGKIDSMKVVHSDVDFMLEDEMLNVIWREAKKHVERASKLNG